MTDTALATNTTYTYRILAFNENGASDPTPEVEVTTPFNVIWNLDLLPDGEKKVGSMTDQNVTLLDLNN